MLVDVSLEQRFEVSFLVESGSGSRDLYLQEYVIWTMDGFRPMLTSLTQIIVSTVARER